LLDEARKGTTPQPRKAELLSEVRTALNITGIMTFREVQDRARQVLRQMNEEEGAAQRRAAITERNLAVGEEVVCANRVGVITNIFPQTGMVSIKFHDGVRPKSGVHSAENVTLLKDMVACTIYLSKELHEALKQRAYKMAPGGMESIIVHIVASEIRRQDNPPVQDIEKQEPGVASESNT